MTIRARSRIKHQVRQQKRKDPAAVSLGRRGGRKGGKARAENMTAEERRESARRAVQARWARKKGISFDRPETTSRETSLADSENSAETPARYRTFLADCFDWMRDCEPSSVQAIVTDPPYGLLEFTPAEKAKLRTGRGGVWRIPPSFDGSARSPLPRFTILSPDDHKRLVSFFQTWAKLSIRVLAPGAHIFVATNPLLSDLLCGALRTAGLEKRGEVIRLVQTLRGGDRPKNAHDEFRDVTVMPRSCFEPWVVFRRPCEGRVQDNLRTYGTGGLRRLSDEQPFRDVIASSPTRPEEREIANHPALKPQAFMRQIVRAALPLGRGTVLDPFMGGGSTIAAAVALGYESVGIESDPEFFQIARSAIPRLAGLHVVGKPFQAPLSLPSAYSL